MYPAVTHTLMRKGTSGGGGGRWLDVVFSWALRGPECLNEGGRPYN
jgi:hypothetical protein